MTHIEASTAAGRGAPRKFDCALHFWPGCHTDLLGVAGCLIQLDQQLLAQALACLPPVEGVCRDRGGSCPHSCMPAPTQDGLWTHPTRRQAQHADSKVRQVPSGLP